jgi:amino acid adenylation domain-containing protein
MSGLELTKDGLSHGQKGLCDFSWLKKWRSIASDVGRLRALPEKELLARLSQLPTCSANQRRLWLAYVLDPHGTSYNISLVLRLNGAIEHRCLLDALHDMLDRHLLLRSIHFPVGDSIFEIPMPAEAPAVAAYYVHKPQHDATVVMPTEVLEMVDAPFDLENETPCRMMVVRCVDDVYLVAFAFHHIAVDGWSLRILVQEFADLYEAVALGEATRNLPPRPQYYEFSDWQKSSVGPAVRQREVTFWQQKLADLPVPIPLRGNSGLGVAPGAARHHTFSIETGLVTQLRTYCTDSGGTLFVGLMTCLHALVSRYTGTPRPVVGTTTLGRKLPRFEEMIGFFVNTLAVPASVLDETSFGDLFQQLKETLFNAYDHDNVPYDEIVSAIRPTIGHGKPLFNWGIELQPSSYSSPPICRGVAIERGSPGSRDAVTECAFFFVDRGTTIECTLEYGEDLVSRATASLLAETFNALLGAMLQRPTAPIRLLPMVVEGLANSLKSIVVGKVREGREVTPAALLREVVKLHPERPALSDGNRAITFSELMVRVSRLSQALLTVIPDDGRFIAIVADRSIESYVAVLSCWCAGRAYLPLNPKDPPERIKKFLREADVALVLHGSDDGYAGCDRSAYGDIQQNSVSGLMETSQVDVQGADRLPLWTYAIYTSGTTGKAKACSISWRSIVNLQREVSLVILGADPTRAPHRATMNAPLFFDASVQQVVLLLSGCSLYIVPEEVRLDAREFHNFLARNRISILDLTPSHFRLLDGFRPLSTLPDLRKIMLGAEEITRDMWHSLTCYSGIDCFNIYGPTECTVDSTIHRIDTTSSNPTLGMPLGNTEFYCVDDGLNIVPRGVPGELLIAGIGVSDSHYFGRPDSTAESYIPNMWASNPRFSRCYRSGDLVRVLESGEIEYLGRIDRQVKIRGNRVDLNEVRAAYLSSEHVKDCALIVEKDEQSVSSLIAFIVPTNSEFANMNAIELNVVNRLPKYAIPSRVALVTTIPMKANGKLDLGKLSNMRALDVTTSSRIHVPPTTDLEVRIAQIWQKIVHQVDISTDQPFISLGGHSIQIARFLSQIRQEFGCNLPANLLFKGATIRDLVQYLEDNSTGDSRVSRWSSAHADILLCFSENQHAAPPLFCIHPLGGSALHYQPLCEPIKAGRDVYGIQSRGLLSIQNEHTVLRDMLEQYACAIRDVAFNRPMHLLGWSLGGILALALTWVLEQKGCVVNSVEMWDVGWSKSGLPAVRGKAARLEAYSRVLRGILNCDDAIDALLADASVADGLTDGTAWLQKLMPRCPAARTIELRDVERVVDVAMHQASLITSWTPPTVAARVHCVWANRSLEEGMLTHVNWGAQTTGPFTEETVRGTHYSMLRRPIVEELASDLRDRLRKADLESPERTRTVS